MIGKTIHSRSVRGGTLGTEESFGNSVALLVDCDNTSPDILDFALQVSSQFGRVVVRRGYGNSNTLSHKWQQALVRLAFTPSLQYQYTSGKNTSDIALALEAMEILFDRRGKTFCIVTSDSDFAHLCKKLRERGSTVHIIGEEKSPDALRNACDQFFEWKRPAENPSTDVVSAPAEVLPATKTPPKLRPRFVVSAVSLLGESTSEGRVAVGTLGSYLIRTQPDFSPKNYGHSGLVGMLKTYDLLSVRQETGGHWTVSLNLIPTAK